jgi:ABC-type antimicrobial peptide transport system permease subunit
VNEATPTNEQATSTSSKLRRGFRFALIGLVFGFIGLGTAVFRMSVESETPPPPKTNEISEVLADTIKKTADKFRNKQSPPPEPTVVPWPFTKKLGLSASICGFIGTVFGCISWLVGEERRWTWAALCTGIAALAWTYVVVAVAITIAIIIALCILSHM